MTTCRVKLGLGHGRYVYVVDWKGEPRIDLRQWQDGKATKKGISLTLMRWKNWVDSIEDVDKALSAEESYSSHLGGNVYCTVENGFVDLRQYWRPQEELVPTKKGMRLWPDEYAALKTYVQKIGEALPELDAVVPCFLRSDHQNQIGYLQCSECNPDDWVNW